MADAGTSNSTAKASTVPSFTTHNLPTDAEINAMFDAVPILEKHKVTDKVLTAMVRPIVKRARQKAPRQTETQRDKRGKNQEGQADWRTPLWKTITRVVRKYDRGRGFAMVGPSWPKGNKAYFNTSPTGRRQVFWGLRTGKTVATVHDWITEAGDETRGQQKAAAKAKLKELMREIWE